MNPELDLTLDRVIRAPREAVWRAWTDPAVLAQWWLPAPMVARIERLDLRAGGGFVSLMSEDGVVFVPHLDGIFLAVEENRRLAFTNSTDSAWRPARPSPVAMTAEVSLADHPEGTRYEVLVRHGDPEARTLHERLGFFEGWGAVTDALARLVEDEAAAG